uniref:Uncharacterized protein n=1 Tax=Leersia perrieri TaxID=77586 RepID=A0A0D9X006_9ORYZ
MEATQAKYQTLSPLSPHPPLSASSWWAPPRTNLFISLPPHPCLIGRSRTPNRQREIRHQHEPSDPDPTANSGVQTPLQRQRRDRVRTCPRASLTRDREVHVTDARRRRIGIVRPSGVPTPPSSVGRDAAALTAAGDGRTYVAVTASVVTHGGEGILLQSPSGKRREEERRGLGSDIIIAHTKRGGEGGERIRTREPAEREREKKKSWREREVVELDWGIPAAVQIGGGHEQLISLLKYRLTSANVVYEIPTENNLQNSPWQANPLKYEFSDSPYTPLSSQFECDNLSALTNTPDNQSSTETISAQPISPLEADSSYRQAAILLRENIQVGADPLYATSRHNMQHALREIETVLMAPDTDDATTSTKHEFEELKPAQLVRQRSRTWSHESRQPLPGVGRPQFASGGYPTASYEFRPEKRQRELREDPQIIVKQLLTRCAEALSEDRTEEFHKLVQEARGVVSINGEPIQRLGAYLLEGLVARHGNSANGAIAEALRSENNIHIIDFQIAQGTQWITLIQALAARPGGPPHVRITGIDDPVSEYARGDGLDIVGNMLKSMSKEFNIPLEFTPLNVYATQVTKEMLEIRPGEALAVNFTLQLHHTPDESVDVNNPRDGLLRMVKGLSPKVTTLVEQESHTNTTPFLMRFGETMDYYSAMFESIDANLPRDNKERISVEQHCLAKDIVNIIACEGKDRVERHELLGKWKSRLTMAGFRPYPLSSYVNSVIKKLLACYSDKYTLEEKDGAMLLGWKNRKLISASAWH